MSEVNQGSLLTNELAHLKMLQALFDSVRLGQARASLSISSMPNDWNYALFVGLEPLLEQLEQLKFTPQDIHYLATLDQFSHEFLSWLSNFRFEGTVRCVKEGSVIFPDEPFLEISGDIEQVQLVAPLLLNRIREQIYAGTCAAQSKLAANERPIFHTNHVGALSSIHDFLIARAEFIGGFDITSAPSIARDLYLPLACMTPPSFLQCFNSELEAFRTFTRSYDHATLLVDHFDLHEGIAALSALAKEQQDSFRVRNVAISSAPLAKTALIARETLNKLGFNHIGLIAYGNFSNRYLAQLTRLNNCPIDGFALHNQNTHIEPQVDSTTTGELALHYGLTDYAGIRRPSNASGRRQMMGAPQIFRIEQGGQFKSDTVAGAFERREGTPLLNTIMQDGYVDASILPTLDQIKDHCVGSLAKLPTKLTSSIRQISRYPVGFAHNGLDGETLLRQRQPRETPRIKQVSRPPRSVVTFTNEQIETAIPETLTPPVSATKVIADVADHTVSEQQSKRQRDAAIKPDLLKTHSQMRVIPIYKRNNRRDTGQ